MSKDFNTYNKRRDNNYYPDCTINPDFDLLHATKVDSEKRLSSRVLGRSTLIRGDELILVNEKFIEQWRSDTFSKTCQLWNEEENLFVIDHQRLFKLDIDSGESLWSADLPQCNDAYGFTFIDQEFIYVCTVNPKATHFYAINKIQGDIAWNLNVPEVGFGVLRNIDNQIQICSALNPKEIFFYDESSLKFETKFNIDSLMSRLSYLEPYPKYDFSGPQIEFVKYIPVKDGSILAYNVLSDEIIWHHKIGMPKWFTGFNAVTAQNIIVKENEIYFNIEQGLYGNKNFLTILDKNSGDLTFQCQKPFADKGFYFPVIVGKYFIGGNDNQLVFFDTELKKFVHKYTYKQDIKGLFSAFQIANNRIVRTVSDLSTVFWFGNCDSK